MSWSLFLEKIPPEGIASTQIIALEIDPRVPSMTIGPRNRTGGRSDLWNRALIRIHLDGWSSIEAKIGEWFSTTEITEYLQTIGAGYRADTLWSGDTIGHWNEAAIQSVDALIDSLGSHFPEK